MKLLELVKYHFKRMKDTSSMFLLVDLGLVIFRNETEVIKALELGELREATLALMEKHLKYVLYADEGYRVTGKEEVVAEMQHSYFFEKDSPFLYPAQFVVMYEFFFHQWKEKHPYAEAE